MNKLVRVRRRSCQICGIWIVPGMRPWGVVVKSPGGVQVSVACCADCLREWADAMDSLDIAVRTQP